ncbi:MAG: DEAD/DEAH box helicase [Firmicutes bacterium]|nr:DEAD/DEAH box helicase [Bacillota bacterium]
MGFAPAGGLPDMLNQIRDILGPNGAVAKQLIDYEHRPGQLEMAEIVAKALWEGKVGLVEAGTGTGKSLAYLIPAIFWSVQHKEKVVVSTNTITLQEQLIKKDIPFLNKVLDFPFQAALLKGWANYVCLNRLYNLNHYQQSLWDGNLDELGLVLEWVKRNQGGSRGELGFSVSDEFWQEICSESDACLRGNCSYFDRCFYFRDRRQAVEADIIITNHHLLFADLSLRRILGFDTNWSVLPPYRYVIWDEAHHVEATATNYFGRRLSRRGVARLLRRLYHRRGDKETGLLAHIYFLLAEPASSGSAGKYKDPAYLKKELDENVIPRLLEAEAVCRKFFGKLTELIEANPQGNRLLVLSPAPKAPMLRELMGQEVDLMSKVWRDFTSTVLDFKERFDDGHDQNRETAGAELAAVCGRLKEIGTNLAYFTSRPESNFVSWAELSPRQKEPSLIAAPIEVAEHLRNDVYQHLKGAVFTSATLAVDQGFDHIIKRLGLNLEGDMNQEHCLIEPPICAVVSSPFYYQEQVLLCVPQDLTAPQKGRHGRELAQYVLDVLLMSKGRAFVLFTSYSQLNAVYRYCRVPLAQANIEALCQGTAPRGRLLNSFRSDTHSVLFGTSSFWEGVDVPGEPLSCVILTKLPFPVPTEPVTAARASGLEQQGENGFVNYMLPQAVIRFKQGFGRLIRRSTDQGVVVVCDNRILTKSYGKTFLKSIPSCKVIASSAENTLQAISQWLCP